MTHWIQDNDIQQVSVSPEGTEGLLAYERDGMGGRWGRGGGEVARFRCDEKFRVEFPQICSEEWSTFFRIFWKRGQPCFLQKIS